MSAAQMALLAVYPPPWGGVANHVHRLSALLEERGVSHVIYNAVSASTDGRRVVPVASSRSQWLLRYAVTAEERLIYVFSDRLAVWLVAALMARRGKRVIIRLRNHALTTYMSRARTRALASFALRNVTHVVAVSRALANAAEAAGVPADRVLHQPGFLPPSGNALAETGLSEAQRMFLANHSPVIAANGKVGLHDGVDLYGLDQLVELVGRLVPRYPRLGLAISFWDHLTTDEPRLAVLRQRAAALGVEKHILFHTESRPFVPLLARSQLFVRPTCTDGDANSVREALFLGIPTIASDVVERPRGATLVKTRDLEDLTLKVEAALACSDKQAPDRSVIDLAGVERYLALLERLAS